MSKYFEISGYWVNPNDLTDKTDTFDGYIVKQYDDAIEGEEDHIFYYGMNESDLIEMIEALDHNMRLFAKQVNNQFLIDINHINGAGAAGGLWAGLAFFLNAKLTPGISFFMDELKLESRMVESDIIITGEGKIDEQSLHGTVITGIISKAKKLNKKVILICGLNELNLDSVNQLVIHSI